ncbi:hypothetical protein BDY21DRAFT_37605 [Lineolata rhizophorae]|uniref:Malate dehydrogenase n=1 Tax=Lineolata rhizophorae TaxID=578093 RepID=A0A6A6P1A4_9PEZI|nr:hypothetical protein BDY21DRAFT_37605 [Lineolata rhizophorae]
MAVLKSLILAAAAMSTSALALGDRIQAREVTLSYGIPQTGTGEELSFSEADLPTLRFVTIGRGVQNYTCASPSDAPVQKGPAAGAVAQLFDATAEVANNQPLVDAVTNVAVGNPRPDLAADALASLFPLNGQFAPVAHHFFTADGVPTFDFGERGLLSGAKLENVPAPDDAAASPNGAAAVDWLLIDAVEPSNQFSKVARIVTAGGKPPASCEGQESVIAVDYAAQYWFWA